MPPEPLSQLRFDPRRWSFSLSGLMLLVAMVAIAVVTGKESMLGLVEQVRLCLAEAGQPQSLLGIWDRFLIVLASLAYAIIVPTAACMALSLVQHAVVLAWRHRPPRHAGLPRHCGWLFDVAGRVLLAILLVSYANLDDWYFELQSQWLRIEDFNVIEAFRRLRDAAFLLAILAVIAWNVPPKPAPLRSNLRDRIIGATAIIPVIVVSLWIWMWSSFLPSIVYMAVLGIEFSGPLKLHDPASPLLLSERVGEFWTRAALASMAALVSAVAVRRLSQVWGRAPRQRIVCFVVLILGWVSQLWFLRWVYPAGMHQLSPALSESLMRHEASLFLVVAVALGLISSLAAYRAVRRTSPLPTIVSQPARYVYFYEGWIALVLVTLAAALMLIALFSISPDESGCLWLALLLVCVRCGWQRWRNRGQPRTRIEWDLPPLQFAVFCLANFITISTAAATLGLFSFINWFGPWIHWRMFEPV